MRSPRALLVVAALGLVPVLVACSSDDDGGEAVTTTTTSVPATSDVVEPIEVGDDTVVIDVRTPEEYAEGHLDGAVNISLQADDFDERIDELDRDGSYVVYCRTGNRSAEAAAKMADAGFTDVTDAGGIEDAATATGIEVVTP